MTSRPLALALVLGAAASALAFGGCTEEECAGGAGSIQLEITAVAPTHTSVRSVEVHLTIGGEERVKRFDVGATLEDGTTSIGVALDPAPAGEFAGSVSARAFDAAGGAGRVVATGSETFTGQGASCTRVPLTLRAAAPGDDAGISDAGPGDPDASLDAGPTADAVAGDDAMAGDDATPGADAPDLDGAPAPDAGTGDGGPVEAGVDAGPTCGNGVIEGTEVCDGTTSIETCFAYGYLVGNLICQNQCGTVSAAGCSNEIDEVAELQSAIAQSYARPGHETIGLFPQTFALGARLVLDECTVACPAGGPAGIRIHPLSGPVIFTGFGIEVRSGGNVLDQLTIQNAAEAIRLLDTHNRDSDGNTLSGLWITNSTVRPTTVIRVESDQNVITGNRIENSNPGNASYGVEIREGDGNQVTMNILSGGFGWAISAHETNFSPQTRIDHNSVRLTGAGSRGVSFTDSSGICYANNAVWGTTTSTGVRASNVTLSGSCPGGASNRNLTANHQFTCTGNRCGTLCPAALCTESGDPGYSIAPGGEEAWLCLRPAGHPLGDRGLDVGRDLFDGNPANFTGSAPPVGARDLGTTRAYGTVVTTCP
ncbi:MAG: hypothetical protein IT384_12295 [Deltaproteobacteria bacterium]|nr:hypothetical protein [Deltaproteobacteria bacterium]